MTRQDYRIQLDNIFEGPMDLLVHLIKKNELDIYDIPIALITDQYLAYLEWMKTLNIDFAGDFLVMAATLTQIKSKMLLPVHDGHEDDEDPRMEIAKPLQEYLQIKSAAERLAQRNILGDTTFARKPDKEEVDPEEDGGFIQVGLFELIDAFQKILRNLPAAHQVDFSSEKVTVREKISLIADILEERGTVAFTELFDPKADKVDIITTFLAILEMVKLNLIKISQHVESGVIRLYYL
jgi:segregation and condensation protein A